MFMDEFNSGVNTVRVVSKSQEVIKARDQIMYISSIHLSQIIGLYSQSSRTLVLSLSINRYV